MNSSSNVDPSDEQTRSLKVVGSEQAEEGHEGDEDDDVEEKYELFRNMPSMALCGDYCP